MKFNISYILYLFFSVILLQGCSSPEQASDAQFVRTADIQPYMEQWDSNKERLARLSTMEEDLSMLIQALAMQTDINTLPKEMRVKLTHEKHGSSLDKHQLNKPQATFETEKIVFAVKLSRFLVETGAQSQLNDLKKSFAQIFNILQYRIETQEIEGTVFYNLVVGPVNNQVQAEQLCTVFKQAGNRCSIIEY